LGYAGCNAQLQLEKEVYYNRKRLHSKLGYASLKAFEAKKVV
jgi:hypothetical protein